MLYVIIALGVSAGILVAFSAASRRRPDLGIVDGRLRPCPPTPNCVCSQQSDEQQRIEPLACHGDPQAEFSRLQAVIRGLPRTTLIAERPGYARYEFVSRLVRYVDDVEFLLDAEQGVIHVRSASRVGRSDFGANRGRVEEIRRQFAQAADSR